MGKLGSTEVFGNLQVKRNLEVSGELTKNGITIPSVDDNIATATKLETARIIALSGDVSGSAGFDGSGNVTITATVSDDSHNHVISNINGLQTALDGKVDDSQVLTNVPAGAKFTDTTYSIGDGGLTEKNFTSTLKSKLDGITSGANNYTHPSTHPATIVTQDASHRFTTDSEKATWNAKANAHSHPYRPDTWLPSVGDIGAEPSFVKNNAFNKSFGTTIGTVSQGNHDHDSRYYTESEIDAQMDSKSDTTHTHVITWDGIDGKPVSYDPVAHDHDSRYYTETESDARFVNKSGSTMTGDLTLSKEQPTFRLYDTNGDAGNYPRILFDTANNQGVMLRHTEFDGELPEGGYGLLLEKSTNNNQTFGTTLVVEGNIYADGNKKVYHQGFKPTATEIGAATDLHNHDDRYYTETEMDTFLSGKAATHSHPYLGTVGGTLTGNATFTNNQTGIIWERNSDGAFIKFKNDSDADTDSYLEFGTVDNGNEYFKWTVDSIEEMSLKNDGLRVVNSIFEGGTSLSSKYLGISSNAVSATKLATARNIALVGDVTGSVNFDGSSNVSITAVVQDDSHNHVISNIDGLQGALDLKADTTYVNSEIANLVSSAPATLDTLNELAAALGDDPNFATTISTQIGTKLDASANAVSASKLATARSISLAGDITGSVAFDGTADATITTVVQNNSHSHIISNVDGLQTALDSKFEFSSGDLIFNSAAGTNGFYVTRGGNKDSESAKHYTTDNTYAIDYTNDETSSSMYFNLINTDLESGGGVSANNGSVVIRQSTSGTGIYVNGTGEVYHTENKPTPAEIGALGATDVAVASLQWENPMTLTLGGALTGSVNFSGSGNVTLNALVTDNSHDHLIENVTGLSAALDGKSNAGHTHQISSVENLQAELSNKLDISSVASDANQVGGLTAEQFLRSDVNDTFAGKLSVDSTTNRQAGIYGNYDSFKTSHIWSIGTGYAIDALGEGFGNLYGMAYKHTNNTAGGTMAGGHQAVWCNNGVGKSAIGDGLWTSGTVTASSLVLNGVTITIET